MAGTYSTKDHISSVPGWFSSLRTATVAFYFLLKKKQPAAWIGQTHMLFERMHCPSVVSRNPFFFGAKQRWQQTLWPLSQIDVVHQTVSKATVKKNSTAIISPFCKQTNWSCKAEVTIHKKNIRNSKRIVLSWIIKLDQEYKSTQTNTKHQTTTNTNKQTTLRIR